MSREALVLLVCCCDFRDGAERLISSKSLRNAVIRAFPGLFRILRMCAPRRAAAVVRPRGREKSADRRRRILISRLLIIRASVPRRKSPFPAYFKGFPAVSPLIPPYPAFLKYPVSPQKFIFYFFVSFIEEVIFRGIIFGLLLQKCKNKYLSCVIAALIFTLPHIFNTDNISVLVMFIFPFLYGIFANEMFYTTKSIWMPTGFHWLWNYTITSLFLVTGTQSFIYVHIIAAMIIMIPLFYIVIGKTRVE